MGGEALTATLMQRPVRQPHRPQWVINGYGPTECTTFTTMYAIAQDEARSSIPIGRAIPGRELYVLDRWRQRAAAGLGRRVVYRRFGAGARLSQPAAANPGEFHRVAAGAYTKPAIGCVGCATAIWNISAEMIAVKIRGFRIELSEIENAINAPEGVEKGVVVDVVHRESKRLAAYLLMARAWLDPAELRSRLERRLPDYMVPSSYVEIDEIPLTVNGKLDRLSPAPQFAQSGRYAAPENPLEALICSLWSNILGVETVGIDDDFSDWAAIRSKHCVHQ